LPAARSREVALPTAAGIVVAGGLDSAQVSTSTVWTLSPASGQVLTTGSLATAVHDATGAVIGGAGYVFAGGNTTTVDGVQRLGPNDRATTVGHLPQPRSDLVAVSAGGSAYLLGGFDGASLLSPVLRTSDGRHFTTVAQLRSTVRYPAVAVIGSGTSARLLVFGGEHNGVQIDDVQQVDLATGQTRVIGHLPHPLSHEAAVVLGGEVWLVGGRSGSQTQSAVWRWDASRHRAVAAGHLPYAVADAPAAVVGTTAYLLGGETPNPTDRVTLLRAQ
jgi:hypothetical protein